MTGGHSPNALAGETSLYLRQHAHNPVRWRPWGAAAFEEARRRDVPIFLSIGYSTCHWCHVMERESFEDEATAALMDAHFVCVKVDREERPDVDELYMAAVQIMTGHGGWPMSVFLEPVELRPFYGGTYFPPRPRGGMPSFTQVLDAMRGVWHGQKARAMEQAAALATAVREHLAAGPAGEECSIGVAEVSRAANDLLRTLDRVHGGFGPGPKFPQPAYIEFLLDVRAGAADESIRAGLDEALRRTLDGMMLGGLHDHLAGGFHRYCVDPAWTVPHFEKMLYDNAALAEVYARAAAVLEDGEYARIARMTGEYLLRDMRTAEGLLAAAQDADTDGREGLTYLWREEELAAALGAEDAAFARRIFAMDAGPNFKDPHHPEDPAASVLRLPGRPEALAAMSGLAPAAWDDRFRSVRARMLAARQARPPPVRDDKGILAWNAMGIRSLARLGKWLGWEEAAAAAAEIASRALTLFRDGEGRLVRVRGDGRSHTPAMLEDYACMAEALIALHDSGGRVPDALARARSLLAECEAHFAGGRGYFDTRDGQQDLFARTRVTYDGAVPCGNSVMANALVDLGLAERGGDGFERAAGLLRRLSAAIASSPTATINSTRALFRLLMHDRGSVERLSPGGTGGSGRGTAAEFTPVEVYASTDRVVVGTDEPAEVTVVVSVAPGHHLIGAYEAEPGTTPLRVFVTGGEGVRAYADYPEGSVTADGGRVLSGTFEVRIALERDGEWAGRPLLAMAFQACSERACLPPGRIELSIAVDPA